ncbi:MAG: hypothetical protein ACJARW_000512 [Methylophilaceae bacterium]|jgi:hypothetical protein|tara:strand:- start:42402 stop:43022 length:621 start_codon:yes stop_codon:yes gene_type:complete
MERIALIIIIVFFSEFVMAVEEPKYVVLEKSESFELRAYNPRIIAETWISGNLNDASRAGFRLIADYIFGNNTVATLGNQEISLTAPVTTEVEQRSEKVSMTAPVIMEETEGKWRMHFVMPREYTMEILPKPNNPAVTLRELPSENYAVIRFSWLTGEERVTKKTAELIAWLATKNIIPTGNPELARYNPPWTPPFWRRNEVMVRY